MDQENRETYVLAVRHAKSLDEKIQHCEGYLQDHDAQDPEFLFVLADSYSQKGFTPEGVVDISSLEKALEVFKRLPTYLNDPLSQKVSEYQSIVHGIVGDHMAIASADITKGDKVSVKNIAAERRSHYLRNASSAGFRWVSYLQAKYSPDDTPEQEKKKWGLAHEIFRSPLFEINDFNELYSIPCAKRAYIELKGKDVIATEDLPVDPFFYKANMVLAGYFLRDQKPASAEIALEKAHAKLEELLPKEVKLSESEGIAPIISISGEVRLNKNNLEEFLSNVFKNPNFSDMRERYFPFREKDRVSKGELIQLLNKSFGERHKISSVAEKISHQKIGEYAVEIVSTKDGFGCISVSKEDGAEPGDTTKHYPYFYEFEFRQNTLFIFRRGHEWRYLSLDDFIKNESLFQRDQRTLEASLTALYRKSARENPEKALQYYTKIIAFNAQDTEANFFLARTAFQNKEFEKAKEHYTSIYGCLHPPGVENHALNSDQKLLLGQGNFAAYLFSQYMTNSSMGASRKALWIDAQQSSDAEICKLIIKMDQARDQKISLRWGKQRRKHFSFDPLELHPKENLPYGLVWEELHKLAENKHLTMSSSIAQLSKNISLPENKPEKRNS